MDDLINCLNGNYKENCREHFYREEGFERKLNMKKVSSYLKKLEKNGDDYKIKHIKKLYRIYNMFYQMKSLLFSKDTFEYTDKDLTTDDFYNFLFYYIDCIKADIIYFIDELQDDKFRNDESLLEKLCKNNKEFCIYLRNKKF